MVRIFPLVLALGLSGCSGLPFFQPQAPAAAPGVSEALSGDGATDFEVDVPGASAPPPPPEARTVEQFDTTTAADRAEAAAPTDASNGAPLGTTIASLGDPADPGFWAETPLVSEVRQGRLTYPATGKSVQVELRPSGGEAGSGTRVSLPALRVLEAPLTALPELEVFAL